MFEWLKDYKQLMQRIAYIEFKIEQSETEWSRWTSGDLYNTHLGKDSIASKLPDYIERDKEILEDLKSHRKTLLNFIDTFEDLDSKVLKLRYVKGLSLYEIAEELGYSYDHIRRCHSNLVKVIQLYDKHLLDYLS